MVIIISVHSKVTEQNLPEAIFSHVRNKETGNRQHIFIKDKSYLTNLTTFCDEMTSAVYKMRAVGAVYFEFMKVSDMGLP